MKSIKNQITGEVVKVENDVAHSRVRQGGWVFVPKSATRSVDMDALSKASKQLIDYFKQGIPVSHVYTCKVLSANLLTRNRHCYTVVFSTSIKRTSIWCTIKDKTNYWKLELKVRSTGSLDVFMRLTPLDASVDGLDEISTLVYATNYKIAPEKCLISEGPLLESTIRVFQHINSEMQLQTSINGQKGKDHHD